METKEQMIRAATNSLTIKNVLKLPETKVLIELSKLRFMFIIVLGKISKLFLKIKK
jgi:hypothetical protein